MSDSQVLLLTPSPVTLAQAPALTLLPPFEAWWIDGWELWIEVVNLGAPAAPSFDWRFQSNPFSAPQDLADTIGWVTLATNSVGLVGLGWVFGNGQSPVGSRIRLAAQVPAATGTGNQFRVGVRRQAQPGFKV